MHQGRLREGTAGFSSVRRVSRTPSRPPQQVLLLRGTRTRSVRVRVSGDFALICLSLEMGHQGPSIVCGGRMCRVFSTVRESLLSSLSLSVISRLSAFRRLLLFLCEKTRERQHVTPCPAPACERERREEALHARMHATCSKEEDEEGRGKRTKGVSAPVRILNQSHSLLLPPSPPPRRLSSFCIHMMEMWGTSPGFSM